MDPLSVTASLITVLGLAHKITTLCLGLHSLKESQQELSRILDEVESLRTILERLARLASSKDGQEEAILPNFAAVNEPNGPLANCRTELENLHVELKKVSSSASRFGMQKISWALNEKDITRRLEKVSKAKDTLQLFLAVDHT